MQQKNPKFHNPTGAAASREPLDGHDGLFSGRHGYRFLSNVSGGNKQKQVSVLAVIKLTC